MGALLLLGANIVEGKLMGLSVTKILLLLVELVFYLERGLWKMFGDESCVKSRL